MDILVKECRRMGNSASVYVPKEWVNRKVVVSLLSPKDLVLEAVKPHLKHVVGAYLYGSYVRGEEIEESDIDALIVTSRKVQIDRQKPLDLVIATQAELEKLLDEDPVKIMPIIRECQPIINEVYIDRLKATKINPKKYLGFVRETLKKVCDYEGAIKKEEHLSAIIYSLMMRLRVAYMTKLMLACKEYGNKEFKKHVLSKGLEEEAYDGLYRVYRAVRDKRALPNKVVCLEDISDLNKIVGLEVQKLGVMLNARQEKAH
jgi:predicted nucleotidyltransferase